MAMAAARMGVTSAAMFQQLQRALPPHHNNKDFVHLSSCSLIDCRELHARRTQRRYVGGIGIVLASAASGSSNSSSNQIGRAAAAELYPGLKSSLQNGAFTSCSRCHHPTSDRSTRRITSGRVQSSKQALAEENRPGKELKPRRKLRLRGRLRLLLRYVRRGLSPPKGFAWRRVLLAALLTCTCTLAAVLLRLTGVPEPQSLPYSELVDHIHASTVTSALFEEGSQRLLFNVHQTVKESDQVEELRLEQSGGMEASISGVESIEKVVPKKVRRKSEWQYATRRVKNDEAYLLGLMRERGVRYSSAPQSVSASLRSLLLTVISLWIPLSPLLWLLHRQISGSSSSAQRRRSSNRLVKFDDVAGIDVAKVELIEIVACLRGASNYSTLGAKLPKGVLLVGPPGTGKTLLARAVAGEAGVPFFAASASEFVEMFVGSSKELFVYSCSACLSLRKHGYRLTELLKRQSDSSEETVLFGVSAFDLYKMVHRILSVVRGAARIRELFAEARKHTPAIVFIDELDAVGGRRGRSFNDERDQTLNQLLTEMDGFDSETGVLVLAATNRPEVLDPALTRPGRISRRVNVEAPDFAGRQQVLAVHMRSMPVEGDPATLQAVVASKTSGFVGADLANVVNEAAFIAARHNRTRVVLEDFNEAVHRAKYGVGKKQKAASGVEKQVNQWFNWASRAQTKQFQGRNEQPDGYRTIPYNG